MASEFANVLSELRRSRGLSQRQAANDLGVSQALLSHYENGLREPRLDLVSKMCDYYGVTADYMLGRTDKPDAARELAGQMRTVFDRLAEITGGAETIVEDVLK